MTEIESRAVWGIESLKASAIEWLQRNGGQAADNEIESLTPAQAFAPYEYGSRVQVDLEVFDRSELTTNIAKER